MAILKKKVDSIDVATPASVTLGNNAAEHRGRKQLIKDIGSDTVEMLESIAGLTIEDYIQNVNVAYANKGYIDQVTKRLFRPNIESGSISGNWTGANSQWEDISNVALLALIKSNTNKIENLNKKQTISINSQSRVEITQIIQSFFDTYQRNFCEISGITLGTGTLNISSKYLIERNTGATFTAVIVLETLQPHGFKVAVENNKIYLYNNHSTSSYSYEFILV